MWNENKKLHLVMHQVLTVLCTKWGGDFFRPLHRRENEVMPANNLVAPYTTAGPTPITASMKQVQHDNPGSF